MKIACCTMEMIALIFLLFVSINGGFSVLDAPKANLVNGSTAELVSAWGVPDRVTAASDVGLESAKLDDVEIWTYDDRARSVVVRDDTVVSIRVV